MIAMALTAVVAANAASTCPYAPVGPFKAKGKTVLDGHVECKATYAGMINPDGTMEISAAAFAPGNVDCATITPTGLPWSGNTTGFTTGF